MSPRIMVLAIWGCGEGLSRLPADLRLQVPESLRTVLWVTRLPRTETCPRHRRGQRLCSEPGPAEAEAAGAGQGGRHMLTSVQTWTQGLLFPKGL